MSNPSATPAKQRSPLTRRPDQRVLAGVCAGLSAHLGIPVTAVRIAMAALLLFLGAGGVLYLWLWALLPREGEQASLAGFLSSFGKSTPPAPGGVAPASAPAPGTTSAVAAGTPGPTAPPVAPGGPPEGAPPAEGTPQPDFLVDISRRIRGSYRRRPQLWVAGGIGALLLLLAAGLTASQLGVAVPWALIVPLVALAAGLALVWGNLNDAEREQWRRRTGTPTQRSALRLFGGLALVVFGIIFVVLAATNGTPVFSTLIAVVSVLAGIVLVLVPFAVKFSRRILSERAEAARDSERADIAAHLHDSVLQTLSLIRRRSDDAAEVARLARGQERELREWLYGNQLIPEASLADAVRTQTGEIEDLYSVQVDLVIVGDVLLDPEEPPSSREGSGDEEFGAAERRGALLAAAREALVNAAVHAGGPISVYAEFTDQEWELFVRDHGEGFDIDAIDDSRHGVRDSIIARMARYGGEGRIRKSPTGGTEVRLIMPQGGKH